MMQIDFEDVHDVTGWSTEDVLLLHKKTTCLMKTFDNTTLLYLYNLITISIKHSEKKPHLCYNLG
jgi:hypothetical protein